MVHFLPRFLRDENRVADQYSGIARMIQKRGILLFLGLLMAFQQNAALADLMLFPTRIVFEKNQRAAQLDLINNGTEPATYRITLVSKRMAEGGEFSAVDTPLADEKFADGLISFSPRQVRLTPGKAQMVRVLVRKPADLASGEYRSHLAFERIPEPSPVREATEAGAESNGLEIKLTALVGVSIPIIVRHGETTATCTLSDIKVQPATSNDQSPTVSIQLGRSGNRSLFGDLVVMFAPPGESAKIVGRSNGIAVYFPNALRKVKISLPPNAVPGRGTLSVLYRERQVDGGRLIAESAVELP